MHGKRHICTSASQSSLNASTPFCFETLSLSMSPRTIQMPIATPTFDFNFFELLTLGILTTEVKKNNIIIFIISQVKL